MLPSPPIKLCLFLAIHRLKGLVLDYKNPKLLSSLGGILHDSHFIHVDIEADFYVFRPEIGSPLSGNGLKIFNINNNKL